MNGYDRSPHVVMFTLPPTHPTVFCWSRDASVRSPWDGLAAVQGRLLLRPPAEVFRSPTSLLREFLPPEAARVPYPSSLDEVPPLVERFLEPPLTDDKV